MQIAVVSDVHSNLAALEAVLAAIDAAQADEIWCLGDVVGYGAQPDECTALVRERCAVSLNGNHDLAVTGAIDATTFSETARAAVDWTRGNVSAETLPRTFFRRSSAMLPTELMAARLAAGSPW